MKLGDRVRFRRDYVKSGEWVNPESATDEQMENGVTLKRFIAREHEYDKTGIICGVRNYAIKTRLEYDPERDCFYHYSSSFENLYLIACNERGFHKVKKEDLDPV